MSDLKTVLRDIIAKHTNHCNEFHTDAGWLCRHSCEQPDYPYDGTAIKRCILLGSWALLPYATEEELQKNQTVWDEFQELCSTPIRYRRGFIAELEPTPGTMKQHIFESLARKIQPIPPELAGTDELCRTIEVVSGLLLEAMKTSSEWAFEVGQQEPGHNTKSRKRFQQSHDVVWNAMLNLFVHKVK